MAVSLNGVLRTLVIVPLKLVFVTHIAKLMLKFFLKKSNYDKQNGNN
jgi:hypothetical protein